MKKVIVVKTNRFKRLDKVIIHILCDIGVPIRVRRLTRLIHLIELKHEILHDENFGIDWVPAGKEFVSPSISKAVDKLVRNRVINSIPETKAVSCNNKVGYLDFNTTRSIATYTKMNPTWTSASIRHIDKEEGKLIKQLFEIRNGIDLNKGISGELEVNYGTKKKEK